ncbi:MAG: histidine--tRNA ligase [Verrucomicrobia bacterium]|nr:histidine--tRNA ligase [Verrucomicrobiota bacterium]MBI3871080.1 histidine--tRNA ligase [Verrucomicrobiota bacterium]
MERLPGFRDFYPEPLPSKDAWSADARSYLFDQWRAVARRYGFREYDGPPLEPLELYTAKSGDEIVGQLYNFSDKGERAVAMRPEMTPTLARMIAGHQRNYPKPIKWFAIPQLFRYERQQKGRLREHFQLNADVFGEKDPSVDAELIALLIDTLRALGLTDEDFVVRLSSRNAWQEFFVQRGGTPDRAYAFFQVIDKLEREQEAESARLLQALGFALPDVQEFIRAATPTEELGLILSQLSARGLSPYVKVDYNVIRGLAYYTGPVFEAFDRRGEFRAIAGGGRYDNLVKVLSGGKVDLPALGFGMGDVVLMELLRARARLPEFTAGIDVVCLIEDEARRPQTLRLAQRLRDAGRAVEFSLTAAKPDKQFKRALELKARCTAQIEPDGSVRVRELKARDERRLSVDEFVQSMTQAR